MRTAEATGSLFETMLLVARIPRMPPTPRVVETGLALLDPARFRAGPGGNAKLATVAASLGEMDRARSLWDAARAGGWEPNEAETRPEEAPPADGAISGRVIIAGSPGAGFRVALYWTTDGQFTLDRVPLAFRLMAATDTDAGGAFSFRSLRAGRYFLGVLLPEEMGSDPATVVAEGSLGPLTLGGAGAAIEGLEIRISSSGPSR
jgi:hypothetical protein